MYVEYEKKNQRRINYSTGHNIFKDNTEILVGI